VSNQVSTHEIREQVVYPYPIQAVWHALTDPAALGEWLMPNDFQARIGHEFTFTGQPGPDWDGLVHCRVTELDPPHRLAYTWRGTDPAALDTIVTFELEPVAAGTRLTLTHRGFTDANRWLRDQLAGGWRSNLLARTLPALLARLAAR
jgi:uncharacterized protein YndB with AHSA1/START domain